MAQTHAVKNAERLINSDIKNLNAIIDHMGVGVGITDQYGNTLKLNKKALEIHGFRSEEEVFSMFHRYTEEFELQYPDGCIMSVDEWPSSRALRGEFVKDYELKLIRRNDQNVKYLSYNAVPIYDEDGVLANVVYNMTDLTENYKANEALKNSDQRYYNLFNNKTNAIVHCRIVTNHSGDPVDYRFLEVNDAYSQITGIPGKSIEGLLAREAFPNLENEPFDYVGTFGKIALEGGEISFETFFESLSKWFSVYAYSTKEGEFTAIFSDISERKSNEDKLRQKEAELQETQRIARIGSWSLNVNPESIDGANDPMCIYSFDPISQSLSSATEQSVIFYESKSWKLVNNAVQNALHTGMGFEIDVEATRNSGIIWVTMRGEAVKTKNGHITGLKGTIQDITERKIAEQTIERERELFQGIFNNIPVMITIYDPDFKRLEFNKEFKKLTGYDESDAIECDLMARLYPDPEYRSCVVEYMQSLKPGWKEFELHCLNGDILDSSWANIKLSHGINIGIGIDIRERKKAEAAIKESEQRLRELADNIAPLTWVADRNGSIIWFSKRWYDYTGSSPEELPDSVWKKFQHPHYADQAADSYKNAIEKGEKWEMILPLLAIDGTYRWFICRVLPIRDELNNIIRWFGSGSDIHEQRKTEEKLRYNEQRLEGMFNNVGIGIVEVDVNDRFVAVNDHMCKILGYERSELIGKSVLEITHHEDLPKSEKMNKQLHDGIMNTFRYEKRYIKKDGSPVWIHLTVSAIRNQYGNHINTIGTIEDITDRKKFEEALLESEKRFRLLADNISQMAWISKGDGTFIWFNKRWYDYTGVSLEEMQQGGHSRVNHPDHRDRVFESFITQVRKGEPWEDVYPMRDKNGDYRWFMSTALPIYDENGTISLWFGTSTDITEQKRIQDAFRESEQRLRGVFDNAAIGIVEVDDHDRFVAVNDRICLILGYTREEMLQKTVDEITAEEDKIHSREMNAKLYNKEIDVFDYEKRYVKKDGSKLWVHVSVSAIYNGNGTKLRTVRTIEDITERKKAEEAILQSETILKQAGMMANLGAWDIELVQWTEIDKNPIHLSDETYRILGFDPGTVQINLEKFIEMIHPDDRPKISDALLNTANNRTVFRVEHRIMRHDGEERIVVENAEVFYKSGLPFRIIGAMQDVTEQKQAEKRLFQALAEAEEGKNILTALMEYIPLGITIADSPRANIRMESRHAQRLIDFSGLKTGERKTAYEKFEKGLYHTDTLVMAGADEIPLTRATRTGEIVKNEEWFVARSDGSLMPILCNAAPIFDKKGKIVGGILAWQDITERRKILEDLKESEERLRMVIDSAKLGTWDFDLSAGLAVHSLRHDQIFGYTDAQPDWTFETLLRHIHPEFHEIVNEAVSKAYEAGELSFEAKIVWPDESVHWIASSGRLYYDNKGNPRRVVGIIMDITERKNAEEDLKESEEKFRSLFENITEGVAIQEMIYVKNKPVNYKILNVNPAFKQYHKIKSDVPVGILASDLFHTCELPYLKEFSQVSKTRQPYRFEAWFPDVNKHFIINVISPQKGQFATVFEDITEQKRNEQEMKQRNEELTRFIYTVSHDLKSPLVTIKSFTSYLKEDIENNDKQAQEKDLAYIHNATDKMGKLLNELLELSRIGRKEEPQTEVHLQQVVQAAIDLVAGRISERKADVHISAPPLKLNGFSQRLVQLFQNLIDNAVKFMGDQPVPKIEIGAFRDKERNNEWVIFVSDNGIGIDPRYHHKIFGLFEKLDTSAEGTGIGLALIKRIVEVHEGNIWFHSEGSGKGTIFYFTLKGLRNE